jgi:hypothetical protein
MAAETPRKVSDSARSFSWFAQENSWIVHQLNHGYLANPFRSFSTVKHGMYWMLKTSKSATWLLLLLLLLLSSSLLLLLLLLLL